MMMMLKRVCALNVTSSSYSKTEKLKSNVTKAIINTFTTIPVVNIK